MNLKEELEKIFKEHNFVLIDNASYAPASRPVFVPKDRIVSFKWLARRLEKSFKIEEKLKKNEK